jgi:hypothetical protein
MSTDTLAAEPAASQQARAAAQSQALPYAGGLPPSQAWALVQAGDALLVDVRSSEERHFVGHVPGSLAVAWATGTQLTRNPRFVKELENKAGKDKPLGSLALAWFAGDGAWKRSAASETPAPAAGASAVGGW